MCEFHFALGTVNSYFAFANILLQVHIEQGPVLESVGLPLGVVKGIAGQTRLKVFVILPMDQNLSLFGIFHVNELCQLDFLIFGQTFLLLNQVI